MNWDWNYLYTSFTGRAITKQAATVPANAVTSARQAVRRDAPSRGEASNVKARLNTGHSPDW